MNQPDNRGIAEEENNNESSSFDYKTAGERTEVEKDKRTVNDDYNDYVIRPVRKRKKSTSSSHHHSSHHHHHRSHRRRRKLKTRQKVLRALICILLALVILVTGTALVLIIKGHGELFDDNLKIDTPDGLNAVVQDDGDYIFYNGERYKFNKEVTSMLLMGIDRRDFTTPNEQGTGGQADVIVLMAMDMKNRKMSLINIPRDTMTDVSIFSVSGYYVGMEKQQICLSYAYGNGKETSCSNTLASVKRIFYNVPISTYFSLDLDGIAAVNDAVGGVDVVSPETIESFKEGTPYHLMGDQAESFVRARRHDVADANMLRMQRQQTYVRSFMDKVVSEAKRKPTTAVDLFNESKEYSCTNLDAAKILYMAQDIARKGALEASILTVPGTTTLNKNEQAEYNINEKDFFGQFLSVFYEKM